jgi:hypothetical protein
MPLLYSTEAGASMALARCESYGNPQGLKRTYPNVHYVHSLSIPANTLCRLDCAPLGEGSAMGRLVQRSMFSLREEI